MLTAPSMIRTFFAGMPSAWVLICLVALMGCAGTVRLEPSDADEVLQYQVLNAENPGEPGAFEVNRLYYGSGDDLNRPEYRDSLALTTDRVDASKLISFNASRRDYWGFDDDSLPINARVWYPSGDGPFPLMLMVHGNHNMKDFSDPGYAYLGELLASRGFISASVDENFINGMSGENDARGWLLLEHLAAWEKFNSEPGSPFEGRVDMDRIALLGHSRGGEAVAAAAAFNRLSRYPDDASLEFDFNFGIRSLIAIAPVDGQYQPADRPAPLSGVNYLVFHGSHDGDVSTFQGIRQWARVDLSDSPDLFKAAVYMYRANHGQWNTGWGPKDRGDRSARSLDLRALIDGEQQRDFARIYVSAFLEATLNGGDRYRPIFRDHRVIGEWLPPTMYTTRYQAGGFRSLAGFEEDIDVTSGAMEGVRLRGDSLSNWGEGELLLRSSNSTSFSAKQGNQAVWLGWNNNVRGSDEPGPPAAFEVSLPSGLADTWGVDGDVALEFLLTATNRRPGPRAAPRAEGEETAEEEDPAEERGAGVDEEDEEEEPEEEDEPPVDLTVEVVDAAGRSARVALSGYGPVRKPLETYIMRRQDRESSSFANQWELLLQSYSIRLADFVAVNPQFDPGTLSTVRLVFDRTDRGEVVLDDVGLAFLQDAWYSAPIPGGSAGRLPAPVSRPR